jgi:hypothetical protein
MNAGRRPKYLDLSNIDKVSEQEKLEETNNRKLLSMFLDLLLT